MKTIADVAAITTWRKSSYSNNGEGACIEVADSFLGVVPVRDSKAPDGPALVFPASSWSSFISAVKHEKLPGA